jgi:iron(III) transport system permease protein
LSELSLPNQSKKIKARNNNKLAIVAGFLSLCLCLPVVALVFIALGGNFESFYHIATTVMPTATKTTLLLLLGVGLLTAVIGTVSAWLVAFYEFPFRGYLQWMLMLPLAVPAYISAYAFVEFFSYTGEIQTLVRSIGGYKTPREYWFPDFRSIGGTVVVMGLVLFPYVYLSVRTMFQFQGSNILDSARVLGTSGWKLFYKVILPLVRPAIILGVTLALMETLNDIGAVEHMGTQTLTFSIFSVWLNQNDLAGAAQIALFLLVIVIFLIKVEGWSRGERRFHDTKASSAKPKIIRKKLSGTRQYLATIACLMPVVLGFGVPVYVLGKYALANLDEVYSPELLEVFFTSISLGLIAAFIAVIIALFLTYSLRVTNLPILRNAVRIASLGYAVPGTLIALGIFLPLANFDNQLDSIMRSTFGVSTGLLLTGSGAALVFAYVVRFMAMAEGSITNGFNKLSPNIDMAGRSLGRTRAQVLKSILLPILKPAIIGAGLLVFIEVIKELSATIMLKPFGVNTLSTYVYDYASQARVEDAAIGCLLIIAAGAVPVVLLLRISDR